MEAIFNRRANLVAWLDNYSHIIFNLQNKPVAHIAKGAVYTYRSEHLGYFDRGFFRDLSGNAIAFIRERSGGPLTAIAPSRGLAPAPRFAMTPPTPPPAPALPMATYRWSVLDWHSFLGAVSLPTGPATADGRPASITRTKPLGDTTARVLFSE